MEKSITWKIGGPAGFGIMVSGTILAKAFARAGLYLASTTEYPSLIRGGHNTYIIRASAEEIFSLIFSVDLLVALNQETIILHKDELSQGAGLIYDSEDPEIGKDLLPEANCHLFPVPLVKLATQDGGAKLMMNNVALGSSWAVMNLPFEILAGVVADVFNKKGEEIIKENLQAAKAGFEYIKKNFPHDFDYQLHEGQAPKRLVLSGNEAIGLGAIMAGLGFAALYPMTPINGLLQFLASKSEEAGFVFKQPEDEIAGINMAIGASYAGARSLVATSGGGFSLMTEAYSMAAMTETPLVVVMGIRPGPSSGLPTWTGQGDLKFVLGASPGDFTRIVLTPGDPQECFELTQVAFNLADRYQTPVILLVDKFLCESLGTIEKAKIATERIAIDRGKLLDLSAADYKRYQITEDGISPRILPGKIFFVTDSYEHDEMGLATEDASMIKKMVEKRGRKFSLLEKEVPEPQLFGDQDAEITLVGWGSTKGAAREAIGRLKTQHVGLKINYLHLNWINPFPKEAVTKILSKAKKIISCEGNATGQMAGFLREQTGVEIKKQILKYDGRAFFPEDIIEGVKKYA
ncbi:MAG: 2-oxoacid:acceptor oxidoreductase subunit alpha [Patescibacteria group bacterium]|nr:2-oxoacid:acceptor oxidoreductase subunit alpha [Patescibacteria group bacterium]MCL5095870.1 2-oxoacid:acceptor oxidoreductase subunit alpha [Patescibacteria group bacterium]